MMFKQLVERFLSWLWQRPEPPTPTFEQWLFEEHGELGIILGQGPRRADFYRIWQAQARAEWAPPIEGEHSR